MDSHSAAPAFYENAREQIVNYIPMLEAATYVWLGAVGAVAGFALTNEGGLVPAPPLLPPPILTSHSLRGSGT